MQSLEQNCNAKLSEPHAILAFVIRERKRERETAMKLELLQWNIIGIRPLMQTNWKNTMSTDTGSTTKTTARKKERLKPFDEAERQLYIDDGLHYHPALAFWRAIMDVLSGRTIGSTAASTILPRSVFPLADERFVLCDPATLDKKKPKPLTAKKWQMDSSRVVNVKAGALIVHRPQWPLWSGVLTWEIDLEFFPKSSVDAALTIIADILGIAGRFGVGAGRTRFNEKTKKWGGIGRGKFQAMPRGIAPDEMAAHGSGDVRTLGDEE